MLGGGHISCHCGVVEGLPVLVGQNEAPLAEEGSTDNNNTDYGTLF